jgi:putative ABC transport system ATP-binding protein
MILSLSGVRKSYTTTEGTIEILKGVDLDVAASESVPLTGESGSGKSTLLHLVGGLDHAHGGSVVMGGQDLASFDDGAHARYRRTQVGHVFQQFNLIPSLNVAANISFHAKLADRHDPAWESALTEKLGLSAYLARYPEQLSGGQQQRVAIGRTLAARPPLILAVAVRLSKGALTRWFWADTRLQLPGLWLALMALLLALSANIGVGTMVSSFRLTFMGWLDQRLTAELYVTAQDEEQARRLQEWLPQHARAVLPIWSVERDVRGGATADIRRGG